MSYRIARIPEGFYVYSIDTERRAVTVWSDTLHNTVEEAQSLVNVLTHDDDMWATAMEVDAAQSRFEVAAL